MTVWTQDQWTTKGLAPTVDRQQFAARIRCGSREGRSLIGSEIQDLTFGQYTDVFRQTTKAKFVKTSAAGTIRNAWPTFAPVKTTDGCESAGYTINMSK